MNRHDTASGARAFFILALSVILLSGCGGTYDASVTGVVTLDGKPVPRGTVAFRPTAEGPPAFGLIQSDGSYLVRVGHEEGLPSGEYEVTVAANEKSAENPNSSDAPAPGKPITPIWYKSPKTSGLRFTVEEGANTIDLPLTSKPPSRWQSPRR